MKTVDERLRKFHANNNPDPLAVEALLQSTVQVSAERPSSFFKQLFTANNFSWKHYVTAACLSCLVFAFVGFSFHEQGSLNERTQRTVREVALNHKTRLEPEHKSTRLAELDQIMQQLPFALRIPEQLNNDYTVDGSRYCSLAGHLAAHIKLRNAKNGELVSLFVASLEHDLESIGRQSQTVAGVEVELFSENGLFYALASR